MKESLTLTRLINGLWRCPSINVNARSGDCHATDALRAISMKAEQRKLSGCASNLLAQDLGQLRKPIIRIYKPSFIMKNSHSLIAPSASVAWQSLLLALISIDGHLHSPLVSRVDVRLSYFFVFSIFTPIIILYSTHSAISMARAHVLRGG